MPGKFGNIIQSPTSISPTSHDFMDNDFAMNCGIFKEGKHRKHYSTYTVFQDKI